MHWKTTFDHGSKQFESRPRGYKTFFLCSTQLSMKFIMLINVKMPTIVGILIFISRINTTSESLKREQEKSLFFTILDFMSIWIFMLSWGEHEKSFITSGYCLQYRLPKYISRCESSQQLLWMATKGSNDFATFLPRYMFIWHVIGTLLLYDIFLRCTYVSKC